MNSSTSARMSASRTTSARLACTRRRGCSTGVGLLDGLHRLVKSHPLRTGDRPGVERACLRCPEPDLVSKFAAVFESYWQTATSCPTTPNEFDDEPNGPAARTGGPDVMLSPIELRPEPFQERLLEQIALSRERGHHRNLLVAATGTGKTVMAAHRLRAASRATLPRSRCCSSPTARRSSIRASRRSVMRCATHRSASSGSAAPGQALRTRLRLDPEPQCRPVSTTSTRDHFDVVIVDEFHHAAAPSYRRLLDHVRAGRAARAHGHARAQRRPRRSCTGSTTASPPNCGSGTPSTSSACRRSCTSASTTDSIYARSRGVEAGATTSRP